ncbi:hypothetical protein [Microcystis aeruginosa]|uniref:hypothetical protein n=1 Tax=Microcystis aeruginosa TaxID=1126 RepID=UPI0002D93B12|nr:hypothetical protein [Microcystis aeruginosa]
MIIITKADKKGGSGVWGVGCDPPNPPDIGGARGGVGCGVWGVGCGEKKAASCLLSPDS